MARQKSKKKKTTVRHASAKRPSEAPAARSRVGVEAFEPDQQRALDCVMRMMAIPGPSGQETEVRAFLYERLHEAGARVDGKQQIIAPDSSDPANFILRLPGTVRRPRRLLMAHMDTVPICVGSKPVLKKGVVHSADPTTGLGADNRAGCAVILTAALEILHRKLPHPPLTFVWTAQEETGLHGSRQLRHRSLGTVRLAFNWDGGAPGKLTIGATGGYRMSIDVGGIPSHAGGAPEQGVSAIAIASLAIADLVECGWHGQIQKDGHTGTSNVGVIAGGAATNVVTDRVQIRAEARSHDSAFRERIVKEMRSAFERAAKQVRNVEGKCGRVAFDGRLDYEAFRLAPSEPCVRAAQQAVEAIGLSPELAVANGGIDANWMTARGIPTVTLGCGQRNIHTCQEELDVAQFQQACRIALHLATDTRPAASG